MRRAGRGSDRNGSGLGQGDRKACVYWTIIRRQFSSRYRGPQLHALAVQLRNADPTAKYTYELVTFDDECKPNIGIQVATKAASDRSIIAGVTHYCSAVGIATVDTYARFGLPVVVWGAILPEITYGNDYHEIHRATGR